MVFAWPQLDLLIVLIGALIFCYLVVYIVKALYGLTSSTIGKIPVIGGWIDRGGSYIDQRITNIFGGLAVSVERRIGAAWHGMARLLDRLGHELAAHAGLLAQIAQLIPGVPIVVNTYRALHDLERRIARLHREVAGIGNDVVPRVKTIERGIGADVLPRIKALEREVHGVTHRTIPGIRAGERTVEHEITNLWKYVRSHPWTIVTDAFVGAIAVALTRLGLGWLKCPSLSRIGNRIGCGGFAILDELLFGAITALVATDICDFADAAQTVAEGLSPLLIELVDVENALVGCHGATAPNALTLPALVLPPNSLDLPLAA